MCIPFKNNPEFNHFKTNILDKQDGLSDPDRDEQMLRQKVKCQADQYERRVSSGCEDCQDAQQGAVKDWSGSVSKAEPLPGHEGRCQDTVLQPGEDEAKTGSVNRVEDCQDAQPGAVVGWSRSVSQAEPMPDQEGRCQAGREKGDCQAEQSGRRDSSGCGDCLDAQPGAVVGKSGSVSQTPVVQPGEEEEAKTGTGNQAEDC